MDLAKREELQKQAHEKLVEANKLIAEAGELAEEGKFSLQFCEIGDYIPTDILNEDVMRPIAEQEARRDGLWVPARTEYPKIVDAQGNTRHDYANPVTLEPEKTIPWDELTEEQREELVDGVIESYKEDVPWAYREYAGGEGAGDWWHPSRC